MEIGLREMRIIRRILADVDESLIEIASMHDGDEDHVRMFRAEIEMNLSADEVVNMREILKNITNEKIRATGL